MTLAMTRDARDTEAFEPFEAEPGANGDGEPSSRRERTSARRRGPAIPPPPREQPKPQAVDAGSAEPEARDDPEAAEDRPAVVEHVADAPPAANVPELAAGPRTPNKQSVPSPDDLATRLAWHVCPYCGHKNENAKLPCGRCGMRDNDQTRAATVRRSGPWFLLAAHNPGAPGMRFAVLRELVKGGRVDAAGIVRGPTTQNLWTYAGRVRGLAHLFGLCWNCNRRLPQPKGDQRPDDFCIYCGALLEPPANPDQRLEVAETGESLGVSPSPDAGQIGGSPPRKSLPPPPRERGRGQRRASVSGSVGKAAAAPGGTKPVDAAVIDPADRKSRRVTLISRPGDEADDKLLSRGDLTTAFNLDRKRSPLRFLTRVPWGRIVTVLVLAAMFGFALLYAWEILWPPLAKSIGLD